jgi:hypothetical protein
VAVYASHFNPPPFWNPDETLYTEMIRKEKLI